jgi:hypothetical protein
MLAERESVTIHSSSDEDEIKTLRCSPRSAVAWLPFAFNSLESASSWVSSSSALCSFNDSRKQIWRLRLCLSIADVGKMMLGESKQISREPARKTQDDSGFSASDAA